MERSRTNLFLASLLIGILIGTLYSGVPQYFHEIAQYGNSPVEYSEVFQWTMMAAFMGAAAGLLGGAVVGTLICIFVTMRAAR